ncbi:hypothetical protein EDB19DRAFT_1587141, partial [Suillus lakei]
WIKRSRRYPDGLSLPDDLQNLFKALLTTPPGLLTSLLPDDNIVVDDLLKLPLPGISNWPYKDAIRFSEALPRSEVDHTLEIPPKVYVERLRNEFGPELLRGQCSISDPRLPCTSLPLWVMELWSQLHHAHDNRMYWMDARNWLQDKRVAGHDPELFCEAEKLLHLLPWNKSVCGPAALTGRKTKCLASFLSDEEWLSEAVIDMMTACLFSRLSANREDVIISNTSFSDAILVARDMSYHDKPRPLLQKIEENAKKHRYLYAPIHIYTKDHYVAFAIDFQTKSFNYGKYCDSMNDKYPPVYVIDRLQWWFEKRLGGKFKDNGPNLPHGHQTDRTSCGLFVINTIAHNVFGDALGIPNVPSERARWF